MNEISTIQLRSTFITENVNLITSSLPELGCTQLATCSCRLLAAVWYHFKKKFKDQLDKVCKYVTGNATDQSLIFCWCITCNATVHC